MQDHVLGRGRTAPDGGSSERDVGIWEPITEVMSQLRIGVRIKKLRLAEAGEGAVMMEWRVTLASLSLLRC